MCWGDYNETKGLNKEARKERMMETQGGCKSRHIYEWRGKRAYTTTHEINELLAKAIIKRQGLK